MISHLQFQIFFPKQICNQTLKSGSISTKTKNPILRICFYDDSDVVQDAITSKLYGYRPEIQALLSLCCFAF